MNIRLITSDNISAVIESTLDSARQASYKAADSGLNPVFIIVPDRFTLQAERIFIKDGCFLNAQVITFSKLFYLIYDELSAVNDKENISAVLDKTSAVLFMWRAVSEVKNELVWFNRVTHHYAFAEKMFNTINQLTSSMADFDKLADNARPESVTQKKMHDISVIRRAYKKLIAEYTDSSGQLGFLIDNIKHSRIIKEAEVFITGFEHLSVQRGAVICELIKFAHSFTAGVQEKSEFQEFIGTVCFDMGINAKQQRTVFTLPDTLRSVTFDTLNSEAVWAANQICCLVKDGYTLKATGGSEHVRFRDITVCLCDFENDAKVYTQIFSECGIAVNADVGDSLLGAGSVQYIKEYLALAVSGRSEHFINIIKSPYSGLSREQEFELENLALKTNMHGNEITVAHIHALLKCKTAGEFCKVLQKILPKTYDNIYDKTIKLLESVQQIIGAREITAERFLNLFCTLASAAKISEIPAFSDAVTLVSVTEHQPSRTPYLFITGAAEPVFPVCQEDTDIITGQDIGNMTVCIEPSPEQQNARNRKHVMNILNSYTRAAFITCSGENPSEILKKIPPQGKDIRNRIAAKNYAAAKVLSAIGDGTAFEDAYYYNSLLKSLDIGNTPVPDLRKQLPGLTAARNLFFRGGTGRVTQIENFYKCPYYHFLTAGLAIKPREKYQVAANIMGTLIHKIAEEFTNLIIEHKTLLGFNETAEIQKVTDRVLSDRQFNFLTGDPLYRPIVSNLRRETKNIAETIVSGIKNSVYFPRFTEFPLEKSFCGILIKGKADRVDTAVIEGAEHAVIIDYKTGSDANFSAKKMNEGVKLQLPLYMGFLPEKYIADGAYYLSLSGGYKNSDTDVKMKGITKNIPETLSKSGELVSAAVENILNGVITRTPNDETVCRYCVGRSGCGEVLR